MGKKNLDISMLGVNLSGMSKKITHLKMPIFGTERAKLWEMRKAWCEGQKGEEEGGCEKRETRSEKRETRSEK